MQHLGSLPGLRSMLFSCAKACPGFRIGRALEYLGSNLACVSGCVQQHELMLKCLGPVARHMGNLDLCVTKAAEAQVNPAAAKLPPSLQGSFVGAHTICYHPLSHELIGRA